MILSFLRQLPPRKIEPPKTKNNPNPNPNRGQFFFEGTRPDTVLFYTIDTDLNTPLLTISSLRERDSSSFNIDARLCMTLYKKYNR